MEQIELIRHAVGTLDALAVPYALVGSWGSSLYANRDSREMSISSWISVWLWSLGSARHFRTMTST